MPLRRFQDPVPAVRRSFVPGGTRCATSVNMPLQRLQSSARKFKMSREIEPVCRSFGRRRSCTFTALPSRASDARSADKCHVYLQNWLQQIPPQHRPTLNRQGADLSNYALALTPLITVLCNRVTSLKLSERARRGADPVLEHT